VQENKKIEDESLTNKKSNFLFDTPKRLFY